MAGVQVETRYKIGDHRYIRPTDDYHIKIEDDCKPSKYAKLSFLKWANMMLLLQDINEAVEDASNGDETVDYEGDIGGGYRVTVDSWNWRVGIRKYYKIEGGFAGGWVESKIDISLSFSQWKNLNRAMEFLHADRPDIAAVEACLKSGDHYNQEGMCNFIY